MDVISPPSSRMNILEAAADPKKMVNATEKKS
jgi:hypothetical protein